jgi:hypothetical protein
MIGDNAPRNFSGGIGAMRWMAAAALLSVMSGAAPAGASDELGPSLGDAVLALVTAAGTGDMQIGAGAGAAETLNLTATSSLQASITRSRITAGGGLATGNISLGGASAAAGGVNSVQLATGFGNIQQSSVALVFAF